MVDGTIPVTPHPLLDIIISIYLPVYPLILPFAPPVSASLTFLIPYQPDNLRQPNFCGLLCCTCLWRFTSLVVLSPSSSTSKGSATPIVKTLNIFYPHLRIRGPSAVFPVPQKSAQHVRITPAPGLRQLRRHRQDSRRKAKAHR